MPPLDQNTILSHMRAAQRETRRSPIPVYKIAALIDCKDMMEHEFTVMRTNHWPNIIREKIGIKNKIGNASPTLHAETAVILASSHAVEGADLYITDPLCPNCMKNIVEAGIKRLFIDVGGFQRPYYKNNNHHFDGLSMTIAQRAGISVFAVNTLKEEITTLFEAKKGYTPPNDSPIEIEPIQTESAAVFDDIIDRMSLLHKQRKHAVALVKDDLENKYALIARSHMVIGHTAEDVEDIPLISKAPGEKYSLIQEPINRLMMYMARKGYKLIDGYLYCSVVPTSREQVNLVGAGIERITIGDLQRSRDDDSLRAMESLKKANILQYA